MQPTNIQENNNCKMTANQFRPRKELEKALDRINQSFDFEDAHLEVASDARAMDYVKFLRDNFYPYEPLHTSLKFKFDEEKTPKFLLEFLGENLSVLLVHNKTNEILACNGICVEEKGKTPSYLNENTPREQIEVMDFLEQKSDEMNVFTRFNVDTCIAFSFLATCKEYRRRGLATKVLQASLLFAKELGLSPVCIHGECTAHGSQRIYEKCGFEILQVLRYDEYKVNGKIVFDNTGDVELAKCYVKKL